MSQSRADSEHLLVVVVVVVVVGCCRCASASQFTTKKDLQQHTKNLISPSSLPYIGVLFCAYDTCTTAPTTIAPLHE